MTTPPSRRQRWSERKRYQRTTWFLAAAVALVIGGGVAAGSWWTQREDDVSVPVGTYVPPSSIFPSSSSTSPKSTSPKSAGSKSSSASKSPTSSASAAQRSDASPTEAKTDAPAGEPTRVQVRSGGRDIVDATLQGTKLDSQKVLAPPFGTAGWYAEPGWPKPGYKGASVLVGHINHGNNPDVFWNLPRVRTGDIVTVTYGSGRTVKFKITRSEAASKKGVPKDDSIWDWDNPEPVLRLITCDPETPLNGGHYEGNWVVWADQMVS